MRNILLALENEHELVSFQRPHLSELYKQTFHVHEDKNFSGVVMQIYISFHIIPWTIPRQPFRIWSTIETVPRRHLFQDTRAGNEILPTGTCELRKFESIAFGIYSATEQACSNGERNI